MTRYYTLLMNVNLLRLEPCSPTLLLATSANNIIIIWRPMTLFMLVSLLPPPEVRIAMAYKRVHDCTGHRQKNPSQEWLSRTSSSAAFLPESVIGIRRWISLAHACVWRSQGTGSLVYHSTLHKTRKIKTLLMLMLIDSSFQLEAALCTYYFCHYHCQAVRWRWTTERWKSQLRFEMEGR